MGPPYGRFNFYRTIGPSSVWVFAGNSRHALTPPTRGNGPFESHTSGHFLMKELRLPYGNWHSPRASVRLPGPRGGGPRGPPMGRPPGAGWGEDASAGRAIPSIERWTRARLAALLSGASGEPPRRILEQILDTSTVNLISSQTKSEAAVAGAVADVDPPNSFFVDAATVAGVVGLKPPPTQAVSPAIYARSLERFAVRLTDDAEFSQRGDTHFAFVVPERSLEDTETLKQAIEQGIVTRRLAACLLMVDYPNPVFSSRRRRLLEHVPSTPISGDAEELANQVADAIQSSDEASRLDTAEREFAERWSVGEAFEDAFNDLLQSYYAAFERRLTTQEGFDDYMRLAESRRARVREMPIAESPLLFAQTSVPPGERMMTKDGALEEA